MMKLTAKTGTIIAKGSNPESVLNFEELLE